MTDTTGFRKAFYYSMGFHVFLMLMLLVDSSSNHSVMTAETKNTPGMIQPIAIEPQVEPVRAVSVDSKQIMQTVERLKQERAQQQKSEVTRQRELNKQADMAKQQRIKEQQQIAKLREEANKIAVARKKDVEEEKKHLKELTEQKALESKRLKELQQQNDKLTKQKELEEKKLAELNKKKAQEKAKTEQLKIEQAKANKENAIQAHAEQAQADKNKQMKAAAAQQSAQRAENQARLAGEVDKYKAMILNSIGRNWILPENANSNLYSQFRIRLAPDGMVLEVTLTRSSGDPLLDRSAQTAIYKASPLPVPTDTETFNLFRDISLTVRPEQVRG